ncbi:MAG: glycine cleavage system protein GcvH [Actinobacteria bacterium]|nr:glycine cleavage system protein GcvH [Actinomycetota bacterium]
MNIPDGLRYTRQHEWVLVDGESARIGITDLAQDALGNIVHVRLPEVGQSVQSGASAVEVESSKSVSDIYSPVAGSVVLVNESLATQPSLLNSDPYGAGWLYEVQMSYDETLEGLLSADEYRALVG